LENGLGRINRENFMVNGFRFTEKTLEPFIESEIKKPDGEQFKGFSKEAIRVFDVLKKSKKGELDKDIIKDAGKMVDQFVENNIKGETMQMIRDYFSSRDTQSII
jgi:carbon monoxide dehydrogenase subunit G